MEDKVYLYYKYYCTECHEPFNSPIKSNMLNDNRERCPSCFSVWIELQPDYKIDKYTIEIIKKAAKGDSESYLQVKSYLKSFSDEARLIEKERIRLQGYDWKMNDEERKSWDKKVNAL